MSETDPSVTIIEPERNAKGQFLTGHKHVGPGRPKGSRNKLAEDFIGSFAADFAEHGVEIIEKVRRQSPEIYLKLCGDLLPRDLEQAIDPGARFRGLETPSEIYAALAAGMIADAGVDGALEQLDDIRAAVLAHGAEHAEPIVQNGATKK